MDVRIDIVVAVVIVYLMFSSSPCESGDGSLKLSPVNNASGFGSDNNDLFVSSVLSSPINLIQQPQQDQQQQILRSQKISGTVAELGEFPGQISLQNRAGSHFCGGTLINDRHVLTAAHCVVNKFGFVRDPQTFQVMGDDLSVSSQSVAITRQIRWISHIFAHEEYNLDTLENDIAVLRTTKAFQLTDTFFPIDLNTLTPPQDDDWLRVAGWVEIQENTAGVSVLRRADVQKMSNIDCSRRYGSLIKKTMICAGIDEDGKESCQGDSGSGLIYQGILAGVVSFGIGCNKIGFPGVYTDVTYFIEFIQNSIEFNGGDQSNVPMPTPLSELLIENSHGSAAPLIVYRFWLLFIFYLNVFTFYSDSA